MFYKDTLDLFWFNFSAIIRDNDYAYLNHSKDSVQDQYCTIDQYGDIYHKNPPRGWAYFPPVYFCNVCLFVCSYEMVTLWYKCITLYMKLCPFVCDRILHVMQKLDLFIDIFVHQKAYLRLFFWRLSQSFSCSFVYWKPSAT